MRSLSAAPATEHRPYWPRPIWKGHTPKSIRRRAKTLRDCSASLSNSRFPAASAAMPPPKHRAAFTEGGELGYSISHAYGTVFDNPDLITLVMGFQLREQAPSVVEQF